MRRTSGVRRSRRTQSVRSAFTRTLPKGLPAGAVVTVTATGAEGTSEFSVGHDRQGPCVATHIVNSPGDDADGDVEDAVCDTAARRSASPASAPCGPRSRRRMTPRA